MNRIKPYLIIIFIIWPIATIAMRYAEEGQAEESRQYASSSVRVAGKITKAAEHRSKRSRSYWVYGAIPPTMGITECDGPISEPTYRAISEGRQDSIDFYVGGGRCWTAEDTDQRASKGDLDYWFMGAMLSLVPSVLIYLVIAMIPFGKPRMSLNERWRKKEKA